MTGSRGVNPRASELQAQLDGERANSAELRRVAAHQTAALGIIKRRKAVRAVLAVDRYVSPYIDVITAGRESVRRRLNQIKLLSSAILHKRQLSERRATIATAIDQLAPAARGSRRRSIVLLVDGPVAPALHIHADDELIVVATQTLDELPFTPHRLITIEVAEPSAALVARGAAAATGDLLCFLSATSKPLEEHWLDRLATAIRDDVVAAAPLLLHPERRLRHATPHDLRVRELGLDLTATADGLPVIRPREAGERPDPIRPPVHVFAASGTCLLVDRRAFDAVGGLAALDDLDAAAVDLCVRLRAHGGRVVAVPESMVVDDRPVLSVTQLTNPIDPHGSGWHDVISREGPALLRQVRGGRTAESLNIALTVAAPSYKVAPRWGDWHVASDFARSLRRLGHSVRVQTADLADDPAGRCCDVQVVLRGVQDVRRSPGQRHVLWVISHPEAIDTRECDDADLVLVASSRLAAHLRDRTATPVETLLQATDPNRFRPLPPDRRHAHPLAIVAKARDVLRKSVADAVAAGLRPVIYGSGWDGLVQSSLVVADYVPNETLPVVYSSIGVLLADHWDAMRAWGMVSNRVFDALACGTPVITDFLPEVRELFGDAVAMYQDSAELRLLVESMLAEPIAARQRAAAGRQKVLAAHTFDHRAKRFLEALARNGLDQPCTEVAR